MDKWIGGFLVGVWPRRKLGPFAFGSLGINLEAFARVIRVLIEFFLYNGEALIFLSGMEQMTPHRMRNKISKLKPSTVTSFIGK
jgi:hypothetical protein